ncbi:hypothetical protein C1646_672425 [Rhizophagus diaphanus]|nr:hypothetical protein C1646_672425 [Rhizophagus diaphanus] [Rhizophagus sp. MUCL 43196]
MTSQEPPGEPGIPYNEFTDPKHQLVNSENHNTYDMYCGGGCRILILRANLGTWVERSKEKLRLPGDTDSDNSTNHGFWVSTDALLFEHLNVTNAGNTGVRYLCCPKCVGRGPLGYNDTTAAEKEFLVAADQELLDEKIIFLKYHHANGNHIPDTFICFNT